MSQQSSASSLTPSLSPEESHCRKIAMDVYPNNEFTTIKNNNGQVHPAGSDIQMKIAFEEINDYDFEYVIIRSSHHTNDYHLILTKFNDKFYQILSSNCGSTLYYSFFEITM